MPAKETRHEDHPLGDPLPENINLSHPRRDPRTDRRTNPLPSSFSLAVVLSRPVSGPVKRPPPSPLSFLSAGGGCRDGKGGKKKEEKSREQAGFRVTAETRISLRKYSLPHTPSPIAPLVLFRRFEVDPWP